MELTHFSHEHKLILKDFKPEESEEEVLCNGCKKEISGSAYSCETDDCEFSLHERCATLLPKEINHHMHRDHPFSRSAPLIFPGENCFTICNVCRYNRGCFTYTCKDCDFDVCVSCVLQEDFLIEHKSHPPHQLKFISRPAKFFCEACRDTEEEDTSYRCTTCEYWIHKSCALLRDSIECSGHNHPLLLTYSLPHVNRYFDCNCDVCGDKVYLSYWVYHCADCRYFAHVKCATALEQTLGDDQSKITSEEDLDPNLVKLPVADTSVDSLIQLIKLMSLGDNETPTKLEHWSHLHPLVLLYDDINTQSNTNNEERVCDGCVLPIISFPFYGCEECNFFLHTTCSSLPSSLQLLPSEPDHELFLGAPRTIYISFKCDACSEYCNGFFFSNDKSRLVFCLRCASVATTIKHESHPHPLVFQNENPWENCKSCDNWVYDSSYRCATCSNLQIHFNCAMLSRTVAHDWDKHPIYLSYPPFYWHPDEFYCEICEEQINPKFWLYHCRVCDHSFHTSCLNSEATYPKIKYGSKLKFENHPHALKFVRKRYEFQCSRCDETEEAGVAFDCAPCNFHLCIDCADGILNITYESNRMAPKNQPSLLSITEH